MTITPFLSWTVLVVASFSYYYFYYRKNTNTTRSSAARVASTSSQESRPKTKQRAIRAGQAKKQKPTPVETAIRVQTPAKEEKEKEDLSWARELADKQMGTKLSAPQRNNLKQKTVKQGKANNKAAQMTPSTSDDGTSPAVSPPLAAVESEEPVPSSNNVSDMLEPETAPPATLKITDSGKPSKPKREQKDAPPQETKKDRQNKKKAEEKKLQREADEKARRVLEERQRKAAREARGEPAKNGLAPATAPSSNAWKESQHVATPVSTANGQLLDTLANENQKVHTVINGSRGTNGTTASNGTKTKGDKWWSSDNVPSEEEQARMLAEQDDSNWNQVVTKKGKKKNKAVEGSVSGESVSDSPAPAVQAPVLEKSQPSYSNGTFAALQTDDEDGWTVA